MRFDKYLKPIEENLTKLTIDELRKYNGLEQLTDEEAEKVVDFIEKLA
jgi:hypothetical protein